MRRAAPLLVLALLPFASAASALPASVDHRTETSPCWEDEVCTYDNTTAELPDGHSVSVVTWTACVAASCPTFPSNARHMVGAGLALDDVSFVLWAGDIGRPELGAALLLPTPLAQVHTTVETERVCEPGDGFFLHGQDCYHANTTVTTPTGVTIDHRVTRYCQLVGSDPASASCDPRSHASPTRTGHEVAVEADAASATAQNDLFKEEHGASAEGPDATHAAYEARTGNNVPTFAGASAAAGGATAGAEATGPVPAWSASAGDGELARVSSASSLTKGMHSAEAAGHRAAVEHIGTDAHAEVE